MKFKVFTMAVILSFLGHSNSALADFDTQVAEKFILAGDSWGQFLCLNNSFQKALKKAGHDAISVVNCMGTTQMGAHASSWLNKKPRKALQKTLKNNPTARYIYLSLGGNDFLTRWKTNLTETEEAEISQKIAGFLKNIVADIQRIRPDIYIIIGGYDFGNFKEYSKKITGYTKLFKRMGEPTALELHSGLIRFSEAMVAELTALPNVSYIHHLGLAHYYDGNPKCGIAPRTTTHPDLISPTGDPVAFGGIPACEASTKSLLKLLGLQDAYHPSPHQLDRIAEHTIHQRLQ